MEPISLPHLQKAPQIPEDVYVDPSARINGDVSMGPGCSVWFHAGIRGDVNQIRIGSFTNIQDHCMFHATYRKYSTTVGDHVTFGHGVIAHGCQIGNRVLIGMQSVIMDGAIIGDDVIIGAGSLVTEGKEIPSGVLVFGRPAKVIRKLTEDEIKFVLDRAEHYSGYVTAYREQGKFFGWKDNPYRGKP